VYGMVQYFTMYRLILPAPPNHHYCLV